MSKDKQNPTPAANQQSETIYDLRLREEKIKVRDPVDGTVKTYTLRELDGEGREQYMDKLFSSATGFDPETGKPTGFKSYPGMEAFTLSHTLFDENDKLIPIERIKKLPGRLQDVLHEKVAKLSDLDKEALERAKNS